MSDDDLVTELMLSDPSIARLDESAVRRSLDGFALAPIRPLSWITRGVQGAVYYSRTFGESPSRKGNAETRDELLALASKAFSMARQLSTLSAEADSASWHTAFGKALDMAGDPTHNFLIGTPPAYAAIADAISKLNDVGETFADAGKRLAAMPQRAKWSQREQHDAKIALAFYLSPVFERGFGKTPAPNNWEGPDGRPRLGHWPDFFQRIMALANGERATPNLIKILKEARRHVRESGGVFPANLLAE